MYSPWTTDQHFQAVYQRIREYTLVDEMRCYELWQLVGQAAKAPVGALLEVGVFRGGTGALIARRAQDLQIPEPLFLCDTFQGIVKSGEGDYHQDGAFASSRGSVDALLAAVSARAEILEGVFPEDTGGLLRAQYDRLRFVHIDVDVYRSAKDVLTFVRPMLVRGAIVCFDDYGFDDCKGATRAVEEARDALGLVLIHNLNGHGILIKT